MTNESLERAIGRLEGKLDGVGDKLDGLEEKVDHIITGGCMKGESNERRIKNLEGVVAKAALLGLAAGGSTIGVGKIIELILQ